MKVGVCAIAIVVISVAGCARGIDKFATKRLIDLIAALLGLATCVLGVAAQCVEGTAPTGDARWGIWLALIAIGACVVWIAVSKRENLEKAGNHALQHAH